MKIAVINFSGNVGKTTVAKHLLLPRLKNTKYIAVETINADGGADDRMKGSQYGELVDALRLIDDDVVVDVGASNVEKFIELMGEYMGTHDEFDYFVVPAVPDPKQLRDTASTIDALQEVGVPAQKIRAVFNMVPRGDDPARVFAGLFEMHRQEKSFTLRPDAVISRNEVWSRLKESSRTLSEIAEDKTDLKAALANSTDMDEKLRISQEISNRGLAQGVNKQLDAVFEALLQ